MPSRRARQILAEWHELAMRREEVAESDADIDADIDAGLAARIEQLRREYIEGTPPEATGPDERPPVDRGPAGDRR